MGERTQDDDKRVGIQSRAAHNLGIRRCNREGKQRVGAIHGLNVDTQLRQKLSGSGLSQPLNSLVDEFLEGDSADLYLVEHFVDELGLCCDFIVPHLQARGWHRRVSWWRWGRDSGSGGGNGGGDDGGRGGGGVARGSTHPPIQSVAILVFVLT